MNHLEALRQADAHKVFTGGGVPSKPAKPPTEQNSSPAKPAKPGSVGFEVTEPQPKTCDGLTSIQEASRREVLALLDSDPALQLAFVTRIEGEALIVSLGIRGLATGELSIPPDRFDRNGFCDLVALSSCIEAPE
jgi:hypothetical protein